MTEHGHVRPCKKCGHRVRDEGQSLGVSHYSKKMGISQNCQKCGCSNPE